MVSPFFVPGARSGAARSGILSTPHGEAATPCFMAVATLGGLKGITARQARDAGVAVMLANTYHLALRPGDATVADLGGLHRFAGWDGPMCTDSGGYQVFSLAHQRRIDEDGVAFRSHVDGTAFRMTPESSLAIQHRLGADLIMAFDECPPADADADARRAGMRRTLRWLERSVRAWREAGDPDRQHLFGIVQGGCDLDLRRESAEATCAFDLPGSAIGGLAVGESAAEREAVLDAVCPLLPADRPRYLMGVGTPLDLVEAVARGVDLFDCVLPTRMGRHGIAYTDAGPLRLRRAEFAADQRPIDPDTPSEADAFSSGYLRHLLVCGETLGGTLVALHNLAYYQRLMRRMRTAIEADRFPAFAATFRAGYSKASSIEVDAEVASQPPPTPG